MCTSKYLTANLQLIKTLQISTAKLDVMLTQLENNTDLPITVQGCPTNRHILVSSWKHGSLDPLFM